MKMIKSALIITVALVSLGFSVFNTPTKPLSMIEDINILDVKASVRDHNSSWAFDGKLYYLSYTPETGNELWVTDGNTADLVEDLTPGSNNSTIESSYITNDNLYLFINTYDGTGAKAYRIEKGTESFQKISFEGSIQDFNLKKQYGDTIYLKVQVGGKSEIATIKNGTLELITDFSALTSVYIQDFVVYNGELYITGGFDYDNKVVKVATDKSIEDIHQGGNYLALAKNSSGVFYRVFDYASDRYEYYRYTDGVKVFLGSLGENSGDLHVYNDHLAVVGSDNQGDVPQLWASSGGSFTQITSFTTSEESQIYSITTLNDQLYFYTGGYDSGYKFYNVNNLSLTALDLSLNQVFSPQYGQEFISFDSSVYVWGNDGTSGAKLYSLTGQSVNEISLSDAVDGYASPLVAFEYESALHFFIRAYPEVLLYKVEPSSNTATVTERISGDYTYIDSEEKIFLTGGYSSSGRLLYVLSDSALNTVSNNGITGSSDPKKFVKSGADTYFVALNEDSTETVWRSDGHQVNQVKEAMVSVDPLFIKKLIATDKGVLFIEGNNYTNTLWSYDGDDVSELDVTFDYVSSYNLTETEGMIYFNGTAESGDGGFWAASSSKVQKLGSSAGEVERVGNSVVYEDYNSSIGATQYWLVTGFEKVEVDTTQLGNFYFEGIISGGDSNYFLARTTDNELLIRQVTDDGELLEIEALPQGSYPQVYEMNDSVLIRQDNQDTGATFFSVLDGLEVTPLEGEYQDFYSGVMRTKNRTYFFASPINNYNSTIHYYSDGEIVDTEWGNYSYQVIEKDEISDWIIIENYSENKYFILENDGNTVEFVTSIPRSGGLGQMVNINGTVFFQMKGEITNHSVYMLTGDGAATKIKPSSDFNFAYREEFTAGHGKWLFMQACTMNSGCEPYSMNMNQLPTAKFGLESSYYSGQDVTLDASTTEDPDGNILEYSWQQISGPEIMFEAAEGQSISFKAPHVDVVQDVVVELTVTDDGYDKDTTSQSFKVTPNQAPVVSIDAPESAYEGDEVTLDASGSSDNEGEALGYVWSVESGNVTLSSEAEAVTSFTVPSLSSDSSVELKVTVTDEYGNQSSKLVEVALLNKSSDNNDGGGNNPGDSGGSSGGGSTGLVLLLLLFIASLRRYKL